MVKVVIVGVSGFIGNVVAEVLKKANYEVVGICRNDEKPVIEDLKKLGVTIVKGTLTEPEQYKQHLLEGNVLINCAQSQNAEEGSQSIINAFLNAAQESNEKKIVIYTSGCLVFGNQESNERLTEAALTDEKVANEFKWRHNHAKQLFESDLIKSTTIAPGWVYGRQGSYIGAFFDANNNNKQVVYGDGNNVWSTIHVEDLANVYKATIENIDKVNGKFINAVNDDNLTLNEIATACAQSCGFNGEIEHVEPEAFWPKLQSWNIPLSNEFLKSTLNFTFDKPGFVEANQQYYNDKLSYQ